MRSTLHMDGVTTKQLRAMSVALHRHRLSFADLPGHYTGNLQVKVEGPEAWTVDFGPTDPILTKALLTTAIDNLI